MIEFGLVDDAAVDLVIGVSGADVARFQSRRPREELEDDGALPDPVELFIEAVNRQMFCDPADPDGRSAARLAQRVFDEAHQAQHSWVSLERMHRGGFRVLHNLLLARELDQISVKAAGRTQHATRLDPDELPYTPLRSELPFSVVREDSNRSFRDRLLHVEFASPPTDADIDSVFETLELWCDLLLLGAYAPEEVPPRESGVTPDGPLLLDEVSIELAFPDAFIADDAAFDGIINHLAARGRGVVPIAALHIR
jgi:hypothetical protein